jgi:hypothetical protein
MTRQFKMHRMPRLEAPRSGVAPLGRAPAHKPGHARLAPRGAPQPAAADRSSTVKEIGGPAGPEPTRYGDWERNGICYDF